MKTFLKETINELHMVKWPIARDVWYASAIVIISSLLIGYFLTGMDGLFGQALRIFINN